MGAHCFLVAIVGVSELVGYCGTVVTVILHRIWMHIWLMADILWGTVRAEIRRFKLIVSDTVYDHTRCIIRQC